MLAVVSAADAQTAAPRKDIVVQLKTQYGEVPVGRGLTEDGMMLEVFATQDGATWTIVITAPDMTSQIVSSGTVWFQVQEPTGKGPF